MRDWEDWLLSILLVVFTTAMVAWGVHDCNQRADCRDAGGTVEEYDCHWVMTPMSCGDNCTTYVMTEHCRWRCANLPAEHP